MRIGVIGDLHLGINEDNEKYLDYQLDSLDFILSDFQTKKADAVVFVGDINHDRKSISVKGGNTLTDILEKYDFDYYAILGNHDAYHKNTNTLNSLKPFQEKFTKIIIDDCFKLDDALLVPWVNKENLDKIRSQIENDHSHYCMGHFELKGFDLDNGVKALKGSLPTTDLKSYKRVLSGHYHAYSSKGNITYVGTPYEMNWGHAGHKKFYHILDTKTGKLEQYDNERQFFVKVPVYGKDDIEQTFSDTFRKCMVRLVIATDDVDDLIDKASELDHIEIVDNRQIMNDIEVDIESTNMSILDLWDEYLDKVEMSSTDKKNVDKVFKTSYKKVLLEYDS